MAHLAHYKEAHPLIFVVTHWINLIAMIMLILSGIIIHFPVLPFLTGIARGCHLFFGFVLFINCVARVIMAFFVKTAPTGGTRQQVTDFKTWLPQKDNRHQALEWIKYYLFLKKDHPLGVKLGVPQKISYLLIPILIVLMFWTDSACGRDHERARVRRDDEPRGRSHVHAHHPLLRHVRVHHLHVHPYLPSQC